MQPVRSLFGRSVSRWDVTLGMDLMHHLMQRYRAAACSWKCSKREQMSRVIVGGGLIGGQEKQQRTLTARPHY